MSMLSSPPSSPSPSRSPPHPEQEKHYPHYLRKHPCCHYLPSSSGATGAAHALDNPSTATGRCSRSLGSLLTLGREPHTPLPKPQTVPGPEKKSSHSPVNKAIEGGPEFSATPALHVSFIVWLGDYLKPLGSAHSEKGSHLAAASCPNRPSRPNVRLPCHLQHATSGLAQRRHACRLEGHP